MKFLMVLSLLTSTMLGQAFASHGETSTDCPMMREMNERNNPKATLGTLKSKKKVKTSATKQ